MARTVAFALGVCIAIVALAGWRLPATGATPGATLLVTVSPTGELDVEPTGEIVHAGDLAAGGPIVTGRLALRNQTGSTLAVAIALDRSTNELDGKAVIRITDGKATIAEGPLGTFDGTDAHLALGPGERRALRLSAWIPTGARDYAGRGASVRIRFSVANTGRRR